ncbi:MAG: Alkyl hydroperoxide reductase subunit C-like protein, partial [uncultured Nocardioides sp.]
DRTLPGRPRTRLHPARPVRRGRVPLVVPGAQGGGDPVLPLRLLRHLHRRDGRHPRPAGRVHDLRHRGAGHLLRPRLLVARLRRRRRAQLPPALRLLAARRRVVGVRRLRRGQGLPAALVVRHRPGGQRGLGRAQRDARGSRPRRAPGPADGTGL